MKAQRSISLDKDLDKYFKDNPTWNASAIINNLVREWKNKNESTR